MNVNRREFLRTHSAAGLGFMFGTAVLSRDASLAAPKPERKTYVDRLAFDVWPNDVCQQPRPLENWPSAAFDDATVDGIIRALDVQQQAGYNIVDLAGFFATYSLPADIRSAVDASRRRKIEAIVKAAHDRGIKVNLFPSGVYSWGFDEIIQQNPVLKGSNRHAMCGSREESFGWQKKVVDFALEFDIDGFHLESADQGRCSCDECKERWPVDAAYHNHITARTAKYIRSRKPDAYLSVILLNWGTWGQDFSDETKAELVDLSRHVDCIFDQGHRQPYVPKDKRKAFIDRLHCRYGTSGGLWVYPPQRWPRLRWFLPYTRRTGAHVKELYDDGGRGIMYYQGPVNNPGVEVNVAFGGRMMLGVGRSVDDVLAEVLEYLYKPKTSAAHRKLAEVFRRAEEAYFGGWDDERIAEAHRAPPPGELHLTPLFGATPGLADYLADPFLTTDGRAAYKAGLIACLRTVQQLDGQFDDDGRIQRIEACLMSALGDLNTLAYGKGEGAVWDDSAVDRLF